MTRQAARNTRVATIVASLLCASVLTGCATSGGRRATDDRAALSGYVAAVEPIRLAVNRLLDHADPILAAYRRRTISPAQAAQRMSRLERRFADYAVAVAAIAPVPASVRLLHLAYARTYVLEDSYLAALASGLAQRDVSGLPHTEAEQRAAIVQWRIGLMVLARRDSLALPGDLQAAGRGEIAPSPTAS